MTVPFTVIGDPQARREHVMAVLAALGLVENDRLAAGRGLVSIGDHHDFPSDDPRAAGEEAARTLAWLAAQDAPRCVLLLGNHDTCRVSELAAMTDERWQAARGLAGAWKRAVVENDRPTAVRLAGEFAERFPDVPAPGLAARDWDGFSVMQRTQMRALLVQGRMALAAVGRTSSGRDVLLTHAGVTEREMALLGLSGCRDAREVARALERALAAAVDRVREAWTRGEDAPLDLSPLVVAGTTGREGGGLLYHRPANPDADARRPGSDLAWEFDQSSPRRFDPRALPRGILQACGHTTHKKSRKELAGWLAPDVEKDAVAIRTVLVSPRNEVTYVTRFEEGDPDGAALVLLDASMRDLAPHEVPTLTVFDVT